MNKNKKDAISVRLDTVVSGDIVNTVWGWRGTVIKVVEKMYKFGQGLHVRRDDGKMFSISPNDIEGN